MIGTDVMIDPVERAATASPSAPTQRSQRLELPFGPLVVDLWEPATPAEVDPILLIHGWGASGTYWAKTARALAETAQVIVPDLPGTGRSQPTHPAQDMFDQAATLANLLDTFGVTRAQVVGHSMGCGLAWLLADLRPDLVERMVVTSLSFFMTDAQRKLFSAAMGFRRVAMNFRPRWLVDVPGMTQAMALHLFHRVPDDPALLRQGFIEYLELDSATAIACADNATNPRIAEAGMRVQVPVLLIAARQDHMMPKKNVVYTVELIPNCKLQWIEECGHFPMVEKPDEYLAILHDFLDLGLA
ncbi:MAG: alpha/beta hydrolase [Chloroflexi bacterium]|nr:alpha/beta hydrolase [Chloroflexota bacterium]